MDYFKFLPLIFSIISGLLILWKIPVVKSGNKDTYIKKETLSVIIPAYNEEKRIIPLLQSLERQKTKPFEIIVVDDNSTDNTASVCEAFNVKVINSKQGMDDWVGKSRACWSGALMAKGDMLLFLDADTYFSNPDSIEDIVNTFHSLKMKGILSIQPYHEIKKYYENFSAIFNVVLMAGMNIFTIWGDKFKIAGAFGPLLLCRKDEYFLTGGHRAIKDAILDDIEIGKNFMKYNLPVYSYSGKGIINFRMYPEGPGQMFEGWSKNFGSGAKSTNPFVFLMIFLWITGGFSASIVLIRAVLTADPGLLAVSIILYLTYMTQMIILTRKTGKFHKSSFIVFSFHHLFFLVTFIWSVIQTNIFKRVFWRGRKIKT